MQNDHRSPAVREALRWFVILRDDEVSQEDRQAFEIWKNTSDENAAAWERAGLLWSSFNPVQSEINKTRQRAVMTRRAALGSFVGLTVAGGLGYWLYRGGVFADYRTGPGERRTIELADGSTVELNSGSALSVDYSAQQRRLVLHSGEAYFTVAADRMRPFIVTAEDGEIRALGTRFNVHTDDDRVTVTVTQHAVDVTLAGKAPERLSEGFQLAYADRLATPPVAVDITTVEAWRNGRLIYHAAPLRRVLHDLERHRGGLILLMDDKAADAPVSAAFSIASVDNALDSIAQTLSLRVVRAGKLVLVYSR